MIESQKVKEFLSWLKDEWIECKPNQGCLKCDELRNRIASLDYPVQENITEENYKDTVKYLEELGDYFEALTKQVEDYEQDHFPIEPGKPEEIAKLKSLYDQDKNG